MFFSKYVCRLLTRNKKISRRLKGFIWYQVRFELSKRRNKSVKRLSIKIYGNIYITYHKCFNEKIFDSNHFQILELKVNYMTWIQFNCCQHNKEFWHVFWFWMLQFQKNEEISWSDKSKRWNSFARILFGTMFLFKDYKGVSKHKWGIQIVSFK